MYPNLFSTIHIWYQFLAFNQRIHYFYLWIYSIWYFPFQFMLWNNIIYWWKFQLIMQWRHLGDGFTWWLLTSLQLIKKETPCPIMGLHSNRRGVDALVTVVPLMGIAVTIPGVWPTLSCHCISCSHLSSSFSVPWHFRNSFLIFMHAFLVFSDVLFLVRNVEFSLELVLPSCGEIGITITIDIIKYPNIWRVISTIHFDLHQIN